jgi:hypothetical protein
MAGNGIEQRVSRLNDFLFELSALIAIGTEDVWTQSLELAIRGRRDRVRIKFRRRDPEELIVRRRPTVLWDLKPLRVGVRHGGFSRMRDLKWAVGGGILMVPFAARKD